MLCTNERLAYVWSALFGSASWLSVNSVFMEMPLMVPRLPEHWRLPSQLALGTQLAVLAPIAYGVVTRCFFKDRKLNPAGLISMLLVVAILLTIALAFFWDTTAIVFGVERSVWVLALFFGLATINCTSNVLFMPYMVAFKPAYLTAYFVGMGLSALVPSIVSLVQGTNRVNCVSKRLPNGSLSPDVLVPIGRPARFSVFVFNLLMAVWLCATFGAFLKLNWHKTTDSQQKTIADNDPENKHSTAEDSKTTAKKAPQSRMALWEYCFYLCCTLFVCAFMNGILPSIQSYSSLPYGVNTYHYALIIGNIANPLACFVPFLFGGNKMVFPVGAVSVVAAVSGGYLILLAAMSPTPILVDSIWGSAICVSVSAVASASMAYVRTAAAGALRSGAGDSATRLFWCGAFTQAGSFLGALIIFPLINVVKVFTSAPYC